MVCIPPLSVNPPIPAEPFLAYWCAIFLSSYSLKQLHNGKLYNLTNIAVNVDMAERALAGLSSMPSFLFFSKEWWDSPYINHFLSADTVVPGYTNPQNLNRFSYVTNNPLRYTDPTGHMRVTEGPESKGCSDPKYCNNGKPKSKEELKKMRNEKKDKTEKNKGDGRLPVTNPIESYCGNSSGLACAANFAQDAATLTDLVGVGLIETPAVAAGCFDAGPLGCAIAEVGVVVTWNLTLNNVEQIASAGSFGFTFLDDVFNNGGWGENSSTSAVTLVAGTLPLTPSWDLAVDTYASGYNHGFFNGVSTILDNGLFK